MVPSRSGRIVPGRQEAVSSARANFTSICPLRPSCSQEESIRGMHESWRLPTRFVLCHKLLERFAAILAFQITKPRGTRVPIRTGTATQPNFHRGDERFITESLLAGVFVSGFRVARIRFVLMIFRYGKEVAS